MRERYLVHIYWGNALCYHMDGLNSNPIFVARAIESEDENLVLHY